MSDLFAEVGDLLSSTTSTTFALVPLALAILFGAVLGVEREVRGQPAGLRTHILVSLGACLFTLVGSFGFREEASAGGTDVSRIASQVVVGIGFLGGGAILRHGASIRGLTTSANLWIAAAIGVACGARIYAAAAQATVAALFVLVLLKPFERWLNKRFVDPKRRAQHGQIETDA